MGLVDYSSSSSEDDSDAVPSEHPPPAKKRKTTAPDPSPRQPTTAKPLPPLPASFHNLYAAAVRPAAADLPSLHQGRRRAVPHVAGNWPSHIYVEWHPTPAEHEALAALLAALEPHLGGVANTTTSLLTSDLGAPLPLHVSLSRPFVLQTADKDAFLGELVRAVGSCGVGAFALRADGLGWFRSAEGGRSFLVLRVRSAGRGARNPELARLLGRCNDAVAAYGQPRLYARSGGGQGGGPDIESGGGGVESADGKDSVDEAFHVSIAWSFTEPTEEVQERTAAVFARDEFQRGIVDGITIPVDGVKVKIGNVVTNVPLAGRGKASGVRKSLFGV